jgi:hypothetical protein
MIFLVPAITEKAQAGIKADVTGTCGPDPRHPEVGTYPCTFTLVSKHILTGSFGQVDAGGAGHGSVRFTTVGAIAGPTGKVPGEGNEEGSVVYRVNGQGEARLHFSNPLIGYNRCDVEIVSGQDKLSGTCQAGKGYDAQFTYTFRGVGPCQEWYTNGREWICHD